MDETAIEPQISHTVSVEQSIELQFPIFVRALCGTWATHVLIYEMVLRAARTRRSISTQRTNECEATSAGRNLVSIYLQITYILFDTTSMHSTQTHTHTLCLLDVSAFISVLERKQIIALRISSVCFEYGCKWCEEYHNMRHTDAR